MMTSAGFLSSKYFLVSAAVAAAILAAGATTYVASEGAGTSWVGGTDCDAPRLPSAVVDATLVARLDDDGKTRTQTYTLDGASFTGGALDLCLAVGEIVVEPSAGSSIEILVVTTANSAAAVEGTRVPVAFRADGDRLIVGAWQEAHGRSRGAFGTHDGADVALTVRVPSSGPYDVRASNDVGDVRVSGLMIDDLDASADVGSVIVRDVDLLGNATLAADVGDALLVASSVQTGTIRLTTDVGNAEATLPSRADVGYDARASASVGETVIRIGPTEHYDSEADGAGETETARSAGFASRPTRVVVHVDADVGDARITTE